MLYSAFMFLAMAIAAGILGFSGIAGTASWFTQVLFVIFLMLAVTSLSFRLRRTLTT